MKLTMVLALTLTLALGVANQETTAQDAIENLSIVQSAMNATRADADAGNGTAALVLARYLLGSTRTIEEKVDGVRYLRQAADAGLPEALSRLGDALNWGQYGLARDHVAAMAYYERGALANDNGSRRGLASLLINGRGVEHDPARAVTLLEQAASEGDVWAASQLAAQLVKGEGVAAAPDRAIALYRLGVLANNTPALVGMGTLYRKGIEGILPPDPVAALSLFSLAEENGDTSVNGQIADMMVKGEGTTVDFPGGVARLERLADKGDYSGLVSIGDYYAGGIGTAQNATTALDYYQRAADGGNVAALVKLGQLLRTGGPNLPANQTLAYAAIGKAVALGDNSSRRTLAEMTGQGQGTEPDPEAALVVLRELADAGDAGAAITAGDLLARGEVMLPDVPRALEFYRQAAEAGNIAGTLRIGDLYRFGTTGFPPDLAKAVPFYEAAILVDNNLARRNLAAILITGGRGLRADWQRAFDLLEDAADAGDASAALQLGQAFSNGDPVPANYDKAVAAFERAIAAGNVTARLRMATALASGPLSADHAEEGIALLRSAVQDGVPGAATELARLQSAGKVSGQGPEDALTTLTSPAAQDDLAAIRQLISIHREGVGDALRPDPSAALSLIEQKSAQLGPEISALERIYVHVAEPPTKENFEAMAADFAVLGPTNAVSALHRVRWSSPNAYVHVVQAELAERGYYAGPQNGNMTEATIRAIAAFCGANGIRSECANGPMSAQAVTALARTLALPHE